MNTTAFKENLIADLIRATEHHSRHPSRVILPYTVTVSRECYALGTSTCRVLAERLGWPFYGRELLEEIARGMRLPPHLLEGIDERGQHWLDDLIQSLEGKPMQSAVAVNMHRVLDTISKKGEAVVLGSGAAIALPKSTTLKIRIVADHEIRVHRCMEKLALSRKEATERVDSVDKLRQQFVRDYFHHDLTDPHLYDAVINSDHFTPYQCADLILEMGAKRWNDFPDIV